MLNKMFAHKKNKLWTRDFCYKNITFVSGSMLRKEMSVLTDTNIEDAVQIDHFYPIYKKIGGVNIEIGSMVLVPLIFDQILKLLNDFVTFSGKKEEPTFKPIQDINALIEWSHIFNIETPDPSCCEGYILNNELIYFGILNTSSTLQFKYKDNPNNTFVLYQLSFIKVKDLFYVSIFKTF